ncbi:hypothetical protein ACFL5P_03040, partial [candidate division KSB1 bacterium]
RSAGNGGRTNHYSVDLNRDWAFLTQIETRARIELYKQWMPQVFVDFHEMGGDSYFFFPAATPINANFPDQVLKWQKIYGRGNAQAFDHQGWLYYTHEGFDLFYPGYGDSWPSLNGATGMTYEQGGGGGVGVISKTGEDKYHSLKKRLWGHFTTSIATIRTSAENREDRLKDFYEFYTNSLEEGKNGDLKAFIIPPPKNPLTFNIMLENLLMQGVEIEKAEEEFSVKNSNGYYGEKAENKSFPQGSYLLKLDQPKKILLKVLFEPKQTYPDTFFYDLSSWSFPYATNIETYWTDSNIDAATSKVSGPQALKGEIKNSGAGYAYLMPFKGIETTLAYYELAKKGVQGGIANRPTTVEGIKFPRGTAVFYTAPNPKVEDIHSLIAETADKYGVTMTGVNTGFADDGMDLGSGRIARITEPKIGIAGGDGAVRHMFDHRYNIDFVNINPSRLANLSLDDVNVLIVSSDLSSSLSTDAAIASFKQWVSSGGVYIAWGRGVNFALSEKVGLANFKMAPRIELEKEEQEKRDEEAKRRTVAEGETSRKAQASPGYFVKAFLDITHPLAYGMQKQIPVLKFGTTAFELSTSGGNVGVFDKSPYLSGYVYPPNLERISDKGYIAYARSGGGHVILFADNPTWREFLTGLESIFLNAAILMPSQGGGRRR